MKIDFGAVFSVVQKGLGVINTLVEAGQSAGPAITAVKALVASAQAGTVTPIQIGNTETTLDALIADFNEPLTG